MDTIKSVRFLPTNEDVRVHYMNRFGKEPTSYFQGRYASLYKAYKKALSRKGVSHDQAIRIAIDSPSPRFWISIAKAYKQIRRKEKGEEFTYPETSMKRKVIEEVYKIYKCLRIKPTHRNESIFTTVVWAIISPAPSFYISYERARKIITAINHGEAGY